MRIMIVGGGAESVYLVRSFTERGHEVVIVNRDPEECLKISSLTTAIVVLGDGTIPKILEDARISTMDRLLTITPRDEDNYVICRIAKLRYKVEEVFAVVHDPANESVFRELGIGSTFSITAIVSSLIEQRSVSQAIRSLQPLADGKVAVTEIVLPQKARSIGKALKEIRFPENVLIVTVLRDEEVLIPNGETVLTEGDKLSFVSMPEGYERTLEALVGGD